LLANFFLDFWEEPFFLPLEKFLIVSLREGVALAEEESLSCGSFFLEGSSPLGFFTSFFAALAGWFCRAALSRI